MTQQFYTDLPFLVVTFWLVLFFLDYKNSNTPKRFLISFLGVALINYLAHWHYFNHNYSVYNILDSIWVFTTLTVYPLFYYYIRLLTEDTKINYRWIWTIVPGIILSLFSATLYMLMSPEEIEIFTKEILYNNKSRESVYSVLINLQILRIGIVKIVFTIEVILTLYFGLRLIKNFNEKVRSFYSNIENKELTSIKLLLYFLVFASLVSIISNFIGKNYFADHSYLLIIPSITHSVALFGISYVGYKQKFTVRDLSEEDFIDTSNEHERKADSFINAEFDRMLKKLDELFDEKQVFKDPELRLNEVARQLGTNRTYVSKLIHSRRNMSFCDFVNDYRIRYSEMLLTSSNTLNLTLEEVAINSGFSNQSSFYRAFVKKNGIPPGNYRKRKGYN